MSEAIIIFLALFIYYSLIGVICFSLLYYWKDELDLEDNTQQNREYPNLNNGD